jgi:hypothetical protein
MKISFLRFIVVFVCFYAVCQHANATTQQTSPVKKDYIQQVTYGGEKGAEVFKLESEYAIQWATNAIGFLLQRSQAENKPLRSYYKEFAGDTDTGLAKFRRDIAFKTGTGSKEAFGVLRIKDTGHLLDYTPIRKSWHDDVADYFSELLSHLDPKMTDHIVHLRSDRSHNDLHVVDQKYCLDDKNIPFSRDILINHYKYSPEELTDEKVLKFAQLEAVSMDELFFGPPNGEIKRDLRVLPKEALKILKYQMKLKIGDQMIPISIIYGLFQADQSKVNGVTPQSINKIKKKSHFIVMHAPKDYIEILMNTVEDYWEKAVLCAHADVDGIKTNLANLFYIQTHAMPYSRGSEAMTKWILEAVARFHGWTIEYPENYGFQSPFHSTIDDFVTDFMKCVKFIPYMAPQHMVPQQVVQPQMMPMPQMTLGQNTGG